jgi:hypothetical protein
MCVSQQLNQSSAKEGLSEKVLQQHHTRFVEEAIGAAAADKKKMCQRNSTDQLSEKQPINGT